MTMNRFPLRDTAYGKHTWLDVRNALRKTFRGSNAASAVTLHLALERDQLTEALTIEASMDRKEAAAKTLHNEVLQATVNGQLPIAERPRTYAAICRIQGGAEPFAGFLGAHGLIQPALRPRTQPGEATQWELSERGWQLCGQKALAGISRQQAAGKLERVLTCAHAYNHDPTQSFMITRIHLVGELLTSARSPIYTIDLVVEAARRGDGLTDAQWRERERNRINALWSNAEDARTTESVIRTRLRAISPYLRIHPAYALDELRHQDIAPALLFACPTNNIRRAAGCQPVSDDEHADARNQRTRIAAQNDVEGLKCNWDAPG